MQSKQVFKIHLMCECHRIMSPPHSALADRLTLAVSLWVKVTLTVCQDLERLKMTHAGRGIKVMLRGVCVCMSGVGAVEDGLRGGKTETIVGICLF